MMSRLKYLLMPALTFLLSVVAVGQKNYHAIAEKFQTFYNEEQGDSIFNMYAPVLKDQLPLEKNRTVFTGLHIKFGVLKSLEILSQDSGYARYKANFKDQVLTLVLALNKEDQIEGLRFIPYNPEQGAAGKTKTKSNIFLKTERGNISGTLEYKSAPQPVPVVLIIAGSGPTDRNGNQEVGINTDAYKMIADSLIKYGISTLRYDKRGVGESLSAMGTESDLRFDDGINDAQGFIDMLKKDQRFSKVIVLGHSEGSLIGMVAAARTHAAGFISVAGAGQRIDKIIEKQLRVKAPELADKAKLLFDSLNKGMTVDPGTELMVIFRPSVQPYIRSWLKYDPQQEIRKLQMPVLIIQGTTDMQVSEQDAKWLKAADPKAKLLLIDQMNHVLKNSRADETENKASYTNPALPLKSELVSAIVQFVRSTK